MTKLKILTDSWWEILIYQLAQVSDFFSIERLNKDLLGKKSFDGSEFKNALEMRKRELDSTYDILHYNNRMDMVLCRIPSRKVTIYESHSIHFGLDLKNTLYDLETPWKKFTGFFIHFIYKIIFFFRIKKVDVYFTGIPSPLPYAQKFRKDAIRLPNAIDFPLFERHYGAISLDKSFINIFLPSAIRVQKYQQKAWEIIDNMSQKYDNIKIYTIDHKTSNHKLVKTYLDKYADRIVWLPMVPREDIGNYYTADFDLVLWSLWPYDDYAMLNMMELECMACKAPIVAMDSFEIIKTPFAQIEDLAWRVLEDVMFRKEYVQRNYDYVKRVRSLESVHKLYYDTLKPIVLKKLKKTI